MARIEKRGIQFNSIGSRIHPSTSGMSGVGGGVLRTRTVIPRKTSRETRRGCRAAGDVGGGDTALVAAPDSRSVPAAPAASSLLTSSYPPMAVAVAGAVVLLCLQHGDGDGDGDGATPAPGNALAPPAAFASAAIAVTSAQTDSDKRGREGETRQSNRSREETDT